MLVSKLTWRPFFAQWQVTGSPSAAAVALLGRTANGWMERKDQAGQTLDAVKRQALGG